jgi:ribosomal protein S18 acetylase RimI-like enzyme
MPEFPDTALAQWGLATLIASWEGYARAALGAVVRRAPGVVAAVFPHEPERAVYNNALLLRGVGARERAAALEAMASAYADAGVQHYAAWVHEADAAMHDDLNRRGYTIDTSTRAMGMALSDLHLPRPDLEAATLPWAEYVRRFGLPDGLLATADHTRFHLRVVRRDGVPVAAELAFDHAGDCGIYNVETLEGARRQGLATALTLLQLHDARARGCQTASLQATPAAERLYAAIGFRDLGRVLEYVPYSR